MAHNLILAYGLDRKMDVLVSRHTATTDALSDLYPMHNPQKPARSTPHEMTKFHTDEYVDFLTRVSPETVEEMSGHGTRCGSCHIDTCWPSLTRRIVLQF